MDGKPNSLRRPPSDDLPECVLVVALADHLQILDATQKLRSLRLTCGHWRHLDRGAPTSTAEPSLEDSHGPSFDAIL